MIPCNYHTHTVLCDGKNTAEEMVQKAIELGMPEIGFSAHSYVPCQADWVLSEKGTEEYQKTIRMLQEKYKDRISIRMGIEQDYYSEMPTDMYDYVIGSVHTIFKDGIHFDVDESREEQIRAVNEYYRGDYYGLVEDYYNHVAKIYEKTHCTIVGHFDLITKYNEKMDLFDTNHPRYRAAVQKALDALIPSPVIFELNTGTIAKGYRTTPYPEKWIIDILKENGKKLLYASDCHNKDYLLVGLDFLPWADLDRLDSIGYSR